MKSQRVDHNQYYLASDKLKIYFIVSNLNQRDEYTLV